MRESISLKCSGCKGSGKMGSAKTTQWQCWDCKGLGTVLRNIEQIEDHLVIREEYDTDTDECPKCETRWGIDPNGDPPDDSEFDRDLYRCTCGQLLDIGGEWDYIYHLGLNKFEEESNA